MNCPVCQRPEVRVAHTDGAKRRRECMHCRHRWTTIEIPLADAEAMKRAQALARQLLAELPETTL